MIQSKGHPPVRVEQRQKIFCTQVILLLISNASHPLTDLAATSLHFPLSSELWKSWFSFKNSIVAHFTSFYLCMHQYIFLICCITFETQFHNLKHNVHTFQSSWARANIFWMVGKTQTQLKYNKKQQLHCTHQTFKFTKCWLVHIPVPKLLDTRQLVTKLVLYSCFCRLAELTY